MAIADGTWVPIHEMGLNCPISTTETTQSTKLLKRVRCRDVGSTDYGEAEFIYLKGVASTAVGDLVVYDSSGATTRVVARSKGPCAVAMSANVANQFGWYMVQGLAKVSSATVAAGTTCYLSGTAGQVDDAVVAGDIVYGARISSADDTGFCKVALQYPSCEDTDNA